MKGKGTKMENTRSIIITGGPTNEPIDEVMKITNMSTGNFSKALARIFLENGYDVTLILNKSIYREDVPKRVNLVLAETTDDMIEAIKEQIKKDNFDVCIHASAVGDYKADFSFLMQDMAEEIFANIKSVKSAEDILSIMQNPTCKIDNSSKISSYQSDLTVKLGLTPKIISSLREWMPNTLLIGCKLLENVPKEELFEVAQKLCNKNNMDYIMANDLADLRHGKKARYLVDKNGYTGRTLGDATEVFEFVADKLHIKTRR